MLVKVLTRRQKTDDLCMKMSACVCVRVCHDLLLPLTTTTIHCLSSNDDSNTSDQLISYADTSESIEACEYNNTIAWRIDVVSHCMYANGCLYVRVCVCVCVCVCVFVCITGCNDYS